MANGQRRRKRTTLIYLPGPNGIIEVNVPSATQREIVSRYWNAAQQFLDTGRNTLRPFRGVYVTTTNGTRIPLLTDLDELERLGNAGAFSFESLYVDGQ